MARRVLSVTDYEAKTVLLPAREDASKVAKGICVTVFGAYFPERAVQPEILVGKAPANLVRIARDSHSIRGYFYDPPSEGAVITVRYADSAEGVVREPFSLKRVQPLPADCGG